MITKESVNLLVDEAENIYKDYLEKAKSIFDETVAGIFERFPKVPFIKWYQYTPSFDDGDPCHFRRGELTFEKDAYENEDYDENGELIAQPEFSDEESKEIIDILAQLDRLSDNFYFDIFGDCNMITITRDGIEKEDYWE